MTLGICDGDGTFSVDFRHQFYIMKQDVRREQCVTLRVRKDRKLQCWAEREQDSYSTVVRKDRQLQYCGQTGHIDSVSLKFHLAKGQDCDSLRSVFQATATYTASNTTSVDKWSI